MTGWLLMKLSDGAFLLGQPFLKAADWLDYRSMQAQKRYERRHAHQ